MKPIELEKAQEMLRQRVAVKNIERLPVMDCVDRVLAEDIFAEINQPPFRRSSMDGYAVRSVDTKGASRENPVQLKVVDYIYAGTNEVKRIAENEAIRIMTGGMLPEEADCVVKQEDTDYGAEIVSIYQEMELGTYFCPVGHEFSKGSLIAEAGCIIDANVISTAVAAGLTELPVREKVKAAVITTGDELCELGKERKMGQIYPSNLAYLCTRLKQLGCEVAYMCQPTDRLDIIPGAIKKGLEEADVVITTGGVSVGVKDFLPRAVENAGADILFHGLAVNPGRPTMVSMYEQKPIISLTGTPCSAGIVFELLIRPVLTAMLGKNKEDFRHVTAVVQDEFPTSRKRSQRFVRGYFENGKVYYISRRGNAKNFDGIGCNCLLDIPEENEMLKTGDVVQVFLL